MKILLNKGGWRLGLWVPKHEAGWWFRWGRDGDRPWGFGVPHLLEVELARFTHRGVRRV